MASSAVLLLTLMAVAATVRGHTHIAEGTPAARFWEAALPGSPMPESIANLIRKGIDHSPLAEEHHSALPDAASLVKYLIALKHLPPNESLAKHGTQCGAPYPANARAAVEGLFFHEAGMRVGGVLTVGLPAADPAAFLPRDAADRIPFGNLTDVLARFSIAPGSEESARVGETVCRCHAAPLASERKACATSLEGTVVSATRMLVGTTTRPVAAWASTLPISVLPLGEYVVLAIRRLGGRRFVACHGNPYPYAVYACHMTEASTQAYVVSIRGGGLQTVDLAALCHFDTSNWNPAHPAFKLLGTHPAGSPVCHVLPYADLVFGEKVISEA